MGKKKFVPNQALSEVLEGCKDIPFRVYEVVKVSKDVTMLWHIDSGLRPSYLPLNEQNPVKSK